MEQIDSGHVHLWFAYLDELTNSRLLIEYQSLLSEEEVEKQARFHFERDRHRYLVTRAMVRMVLSKYADVAPRHWRFAVNDYGKPSIADEHPASRVIEFNVSHTDGLVALGVTRESALGIDAENVSSRQADLAIAERYFAPAEVADLRTLPHEMQQRRFFEYWTLKESYIKARGMGLSIPLDRFAFDVADPAGVRLIVDPSLHDSAERWSFELLQLVPNHLVAVCAERFPHEDGTLHAGARCRSRNAGIVRRISKQPNSESSCKEAHRRLLD